MKWLSALGITVLVMLIVLYEWPKMNKNEKREKQLFTFILTMGWGLAVFLIFFPNAPSIAELILFVIKQL